MAKTPLSQRISWGVAYTVPSGKIAVFKAFTAAQSGAAMFVQINGTAVVALSGEAGPLTAAAGSVISLGGMESQAYGISGFLYDA